MSDRTGWRATTMVLAASAVSALLGYLWSLVAARFLTTADYGDFAAAVSILYFAVSALAPISQSVAWFTARGEGGDLVRALERRLLSYGLPLVVVALAAGPSISRLLDAGSRWILASVTASALLFALVSVRRGFLQGRQAFGLYSANLTVESVVRLTAIVAIGLAVPAAIPALLTYAFSTAIALLLLPAPRSESRPDLAPFARYLWPAFAYSAIYGAFVNSDVVFAKLLFETQDAAVYGAASFLGRASAMLATPFYVLGVPRLVAVRHDAIAMRLRGREILVQYTILAVATVALVVAFRRPLIVMLAGPAYLGAADLLVPITIAIALEGFAFLMCLERVALGDFRFLGWYGAGYIVEAAAVALRHDTPQMMIQMVIAAQVVTIVLVAIGTRRST